MQAVILAAGRGTRMQDLTNEVPKPMLRVHGKTILEHKLEELPEEVSEIIMVIGYLGEQIQAAYGDSYRGIPIRYAVQEVRNGTASALWTAKDFLHDRFVVMMGDDLYGKDDIARCITSLDWSVLVSRTDNMAAGGSVVVEDGRAVSIVEGSHTGTGIMNTNLFVLDARIFDSEPVPLGPGSDQFGLPQTVLEASQTLGVPVRAVDATFWVQVNAPEDLEACETHLREIEENGRS